MPRSSLALAGVLLALLPAGASAAGTTRPCPGVDGFKCHRIDVPFDRTGTVPGTLSLRFATEAGRKMKGKALLALTGGPGQPGVVFGPSYAYGFSNELANRSLVVLDQRGTGGSYALNCPEIQGIDALSPLFAPDVAGCAERIGERRDSFGSIDTADDIEAMRKALGVDKLAIYGVSYGTWVAQQYARLYPDHVERLILDSVVPPGVDPWDTRITQSLPRVLQDLCARKACRGITADAMADLTAIVRRIQAKGNLKATIRSPTGGREPAEMSQVDLLYVLISSDLNTFMQSRIPAALAAARKGDLVPLLRLKRDAAGPNSALSEFSGGLFVTTTCLDNTLPFSYADSFETRAEKSAAALAALPESTFAPFNRQAIDVSSVPQICLHWPDGVYRPESEAPMPDVPTLILSGAADMRTPTEGGEELAKEIPNATVLKLAGSGHDVFDTDYTGCVDVAIHRFLAGKKVGTPCKGKSVAPRMRLVPPVSLGAVPSVPGLPREPSRILRAAVDTVIDVVTSDNETYYAGFEDTSGGGLRGGAFDSIATGAGQVLILRRIEYVPNVRATGAVLVDGADVRGQLKITIPGGAVSHVAFFDRKVVARVAGQTLKTTIGHVSRTRLVQAAGRRAKVSRLRLP
jgi:pimeloyl-ACP methyl ester carboxylesterase